MIDLQRIQSRSQFHAIVCLRPGISIAISSCNGRPLDSSVIADILRLASLENVSVCEEEVMSGICVEAPSPILRPIAEEIVRSLRDDHRLKVDFQTEHDMPTLYRYNPDEGF